MTRGFTVVEILIVVAVISIITSLATAVTIQNQRQAGDWQAQGLAATIKSAAERYYMKNSEYPVPSIATGSSTDHTSPSSINYQTVSNVFNIPTNVLNTNQVKLVICHTNCLGSNLNKGYVYYLTKSDAATTGARSYSFPRSEGGSCTYAMPSPEPGGSASLTAFWSHQQNNWIVMRSDNGTVTTSDSTSCPFKSL